MAGQPGLFDLDERYAALSRTGDPLERLAAVVEFEVFRSDLDTALARAWADEPPAQTAEVRFRCLKPDAVIDGLTVNLRGDADPSI